MNTIYSRDYTQDGIVYENTGMGHEDRDQAITQAVMLACELQKSHLKEGKKVYMESRINDGKFNIILVNRDRILAHYLV